MRISDWSSDVCSSDLALLYATYGRGNKFGGLNLANIVTTGQFAVDPVIKPETIDSYELGLKTSWSGGKLTVNLAGFWTDVSDYQTTIVDTAPDRNKDRKSTRLNSSH